MRDSITRRRPFGSAQWQRTTAEKLGLESSMRRPGRPRKHTDRNRG